MNDLREGRVSLLFADETTLLSEERTPQQAVEAAHSDFRQVKEWFTTNQLLLNEAKTPSLVYTLRRGHKVITVKLMGFFVEKKLSWKSSRGCPG